MDLYLIVPAIAAAGAVLGGAIGYFARPKIDKTAAPWVESYEHIDVPHIEIDGEHVPHPTIIARRKGKNA